MGTRSRRAPALAVRATVLLVPALVLGAAPPTPAPSHPSRVVYAASGEEVLAATFDDLTDPVGVWTRAGSFEVRVEPVTLSDRSASRLLPPAPEATAGLTILGSREELVAFAGAEPRPVPGSEPRIVRTLERTADGLRVAYRAGDDRFALEMPWPLLTEPADRLPARIAARVEVNGHIETLAPALFHQLASFSLAGGDPASVPLPESLASLGLAFGDGARFVADHRQLHAIAGEVARRYGPGVRPSRCELQCLGCVGALVGSFAATVGVVGACGGAVATAGILTPACIASLIGQNAAYLATFAACGTCVECLHPAPPEDPDPKPSKCPTGQHPCCNGRCCPDGPGDDDCGGPGD